MNPTFNNSSKFQVIGITAATTLLLYSAYKLIRSAPKIKGKEIPEHKSGWPYIGHLLSLGELPAITISKWHDELGPIIRIRMGVQNWISIGDPILAHKIFVQNGHDTSYRPYGTFSHKHYSRHGKGIVFANPGEGFKESRTAGKLIAYPLSIAEQPCLVLGILSAHSLEKHHGLLEKEADDLTKRLVEDTAAHGSTDPRTILRLSTLNVILSLGIGKRFDSVDDPNFIKLNEILHKGFELLVPRYDIAGLLPALSFIDYLLGNEKTMKHHMEKAHTHMLTLVEEAYVREQPNFAKSVKEEYPQLNKVDMMVLLNDILIAGTDTIGVALSWIIAVMCNYPKEQAKVRDELAQFMKRHGRLPRFDERKETPYSYCVIREVFRYRGQITIGLPHATQQDIEVNGYIIPAGSTLVFNAPQMHFNPDLYDEPTKFNPERFMSYTTSMSAAANGKIGERDHYAFGWGRRICPGIYLADMEVYNAFVRIFSSCIVEPDGEAPDIVNMVDQCFTLVPNPYKVKFTKRSYYS